MHRFLIAIIVACAYTAGTVWLIRHEGESYRKAIRGTKVVPGSTEPPLHGVIDTAEPVSVPPRSEPEFQQTGTTESNPGSIPSPTNSTPATVTPVLPAKSSDSATAIVAPPNTVAVASVPASIVKTPIAGTTKSTAKLDPTWTPEAVTKSWDVMKLKKEDVDQIGADLHKLISMSNRALDDDVLQRRVNKTLSRLRSQFGFQQDRLEITILDSEEANAFSHPGGYIYVSRGLLELIGEDRDYALEFAIGHEMAHLELHHAISCLRSRSVLNWKVGTVEKLFALIIPNGYFDDSPGADNQEFQADELIYKNMKKLGRTDRECLVFLYMFASYAEKKDFASGNKPPRRDGQHSFVENHYRAHLATGDRLAHLKKFCDEPLNRKK